MPIRVLWLTKGLGPGGAERLLVTHAAAADRGTFSYEAAYLVPEKHHLVTELEALDVRTHCLHARHEWDLRWVTRLRRVVREGEFDVLHAHSPYPASLARLTVRTLSRRPALVYTEHNRWNSHDRMTRWANWLTVGLDNADIAVSDEVRHSMSRRAGRHTEVVHHGIDIGAADTIAAGRDEARGVLGADHNDVVVGTIANLRATKGYPDLLKAARSVVDRIPNARFIAIGQGPLADELSMMVRELNLSEHFRLLGYRPDARRLAAGFDIFTLASHHEGLPIAMLEAMSLGVPVVATRVGGIPEVVTEGLEGLLVAARDADGLADAIVRIAEDAPLRASAGRAAARRARDFDGRLAVAKIENLYSRISAARR